MIKDEADRQDRQNTKLLVKAIGPVCACSIICLICLGSILYVSEGNGAIKQDNHWQDLNLEENKYDDIKKNVLDKSTEILPAAVIKRARELAVIYRQQGKQNEAAEIYRKLWLTPANLPAFASDGRELAALYTDMGVYGSAVESYQKLLAYDRSQLSADDPAITRDLNNLGQCYYTAGCGTAEAKKRRQYFIWARDQFALAAKNTGGTAPDGRDKVDKTIIELNDALAKMDLDNSQSAKSMEQSAMTTFGVRGR